MATHIVILEQQLQRQNNSDYGDSSSGNNGDGGDNSNEYTNMTGLLSLEKTTTLF